MISLATHIGCIGKSPFDAWKERDESGRLLPTGSAWHLS